MAAAAEASLPPGPDPALAEARSLELCELAAHLHAATARLVSLAAAFDEDELWSGAGIRSCAHWLSIHAGLDLPTAAHLLRLGRALSQLPRLAQAFAGGQLSPDEAGALCRVATPADEEVWLELARQCSASQLSRICRGYRRAREADDPERADAHLARRGVWARHEDDGMLRLVALLPPEDGALVLAALEAVAEKPPRPPAGGEAQVEPVPDPAEEGWAARRADALVAVCEHALTGPEELAGAPAARQVVVHVDVGVLTGERPDGRCHLEAGPPLSAATARRLGCDAEVVAVTDSDGLPIDVGRSRRLVSRRLRRALWTRDGTCRFPGCAVPARRSQAHHIWHWALGGRTDLANLASLCHFHHTRLHDGAYRLVRRRGGELRFETVDGHLIGPVPVLVDPESGGPARLRREHERRGLWIGPSTATAEAGGEPCDFGYAVSVTADACDYAARQAAWAGPAP